MGDSDVRGDRVCVREGGLEVPVCVWGSSIGSPDDALGLLDSQLSIITSRLLQWLLVLLMYRRGEQAERCDDEDGGRRKGQVVLYLECRNDFKIAIATSLLLDNPYIERLLFCKNAYKFHISSLPHLASLPLLQYK